MTYRKVGSIYVRGLGIAHPKQHLEQTKPSEFTVEKPTASNPMDASVINTRPLRTKEGKESHNNEFNIKNYVGSTLKTLAQGVKNIIIKGWNLMRVRKVVTRSGKRFRGKFPSQKMGKMVHWESLLERDAIYHFEYHPQIVKYQEQPSIEIYYDKEGQPHKYFPDFLVTFEDDDELLVEIKYVCDLVNKKAREKYRNIANRFEEQGRRFRIMTEVDIRREPLLSNLQYIHRSGRRVAQTETEAQLARTLTGNSRWTLANLITRLKGLHNVMRLVRSNHLQVNLEAPLNDDSDVFLTEKQGGHHGSFCI